MFVKEKLLSENPNAIFYDGFDDAIIGIVRRVNQCVVAYDMQKCIEELMKRMSYDDAIEWFDFNLKNAYLGDNTPVFFERITLESKGKR